MYTAVIFIPIFATYYKKSHKEFCFIFVYSSFVDMKQETNNYSKIENIFGNFNKFIFKFMLTNCFGTEQ